MMPRSIRLDSPPRSTRNGWQMWVEAMSMNMTIMNTNMKMLVASLAVVVLGGLIPPSGFAQTSSARPIWTAGPERSQHLVPPVQASRGVEDDLSFPGLMRSIGRDFKGFSTQQNILTLVAGAGASGLAHPADRSLTASLSASSGVADTLRPGKILGGTVVQVGAAFATYGLGRLFGASPVTELGADLVHAQVLTQGITQGLKLATGRTRPDGTSLSFPSGHAASAFATGTVLQRRFGWKVGVPAYGLATYVAASRLSENRHYLSDVMFGAVLGIVAGRHVTLDLGKTKFALTPQAVPGGAGVALVRIAK